MDKDNLRPSINRIALLAIRLCNVSAAAVITQKEEKPIVIGFSGPALETTFLEQFSRKVIETSSYVSVDPRSTDMGSATGSVEFGAGVPLVSSSVTGALCVFNHAPKMLSTEEQSFLNLLAEQVIAQIEADQALGKITQNYENLVHSLEGVVWQADPQSFQFLFVSHGAEKLLGYPTEQWLKPDFWITHLHPEDRDSMVQIYKTLVAEKKAHDLEYRMIAANGRPVWVRDLVSVHSVNERAQLLNGLLIDITAQKESEIALKQSEERFRTLMEHTGDQFFLHDTRGRILDVNNASCKALGYSREELLNLTMFDITSSTPREELTSMWLQMIPGNSVSTEFMAARKNGTVFPVEVCLGVFHHNNEPFIVASVRDLSERKNLEAQLFQAQKMESVGRLAGGIAHDFNNLLQVIQGHATLLLGAEFLSDEMSDSVAEILSSTARATNLTRQLLTFSRKEAIRLREIDLNTVILGTNRMLTRILGEDIHLQVSLTPRIPNVRADQGMIEQILMNLATNSRDAMPEGGSLQISTREQQLSRPDREGKTDAETFICLSVKDTGCGIPSSDQGNIFEPFFTTKEVGKGTGLGLATVYGIMKQHKGWVEVQSEPGKGALFNLYFPALKPVAEPIAAPKPSSSYFTKHGSILLVEDDLNVRRLVALLLKRQGYKLIEVSSGTEALEIWASRKDEIDFLITDLIMPHGIGGKELAAQLNLEKPGLKIIFTSGYSTDSVSTQLQLREGVNFLPKPYSAAKLAEVVQTAFIKS
ncbi:MAG: PAS domain S-box protein [Verrucomicrobiota bacterium]|nr:PAS domain S-box protein [Verrucomicrobiota bacterium]